MSKAGFEGWLDTAKSVDAMMRIIGVSEEQRARVADIALQAAVGELAEGEPVEGKSKTFKCDFEDCPGRKKSARKRLIYSPNYLFLHASCVKPAMAAARKRHETFAFRSGL